MTQDNIVNERYRLSNEGRQLSGCLENEDLRPKTQKRRPLENEDLENEDPLEKGEKNIP